MTSSRAAGCFPGPRSHARSSQPTGRGRTCIDTARQASPMDFGRRLDVKLPGLKLRSGNLLPTRVMHQRPLLCSAHALPSRLGSPSFDNHQPTSSSEGLWVRAVSLTELTLAQFVTFCLSARDPSSLTTELCLEHLRESGGLRLGHHVHYTQLQCRDAGT